MAEPLYALNEEKRDGINNLLRTTPAPLGSSPAAATLSPHVSHVLCGALEVASGGFNYYHGVPKQFDATAGNFADPAGGAGGGVNNCWLASRQSLIPGNEYEAIASGYRTIASAKRICFVTVSGGGERVRWLRLTSDTSAGGYWPAFVQSWSGSAWVDAEAVKVAIRSGNRFVSGGYYQGTLNGTAESLPLYHANGNQRTVLKVCDENGNERCDAFFFAAPFKQDANVNCDGTETTPSGLAFNRKENSQYKVAPSPMRI